MHYADLLAAATDKLLPFIRHKPIRHNNTDANDQNVTSSVADFALTLFFNGNTRETLEHLLLIVLIYVIVCLVFYYLLVSPAHGSTFLDSTRFPHAKRVLIVIAHPDDECMFFGPTILHLAARKKCEVYLLCLSTGNFEQKGNLRRDELWQACRVLRIKPEHITLIHASKLVDDPNVTWNSDTIARLVCNTVESLDIDTVITFDRDGVSHHPNHCAIFYATASLFLSGLLPKNCKVYTLDTTNVLRKYIFLLDLILTRIISNHWFVVNWKEHKVLQEAMAQHRSQMLWFRRIYIRCSRYMVINSLRELVATDVELEMQIEES